MRRITIHTMAGSGYHDTLRQAPANGVSLAPEDGSGCSRK